MLGSFITFSDNKLSYKSAEIEVSSTVFSKEVSKITSAFIRCIAHIMLKTK